MDFRRININKLVPADYNPRLDLVPGDSDYEKIKNSINEFGYCEPIIINTDFTVIGGHQRLKVLKDLGYNEIQCCIIDIPDKSKEKALNIALNKISGDWDLERLNNIMKEIEGDIDLSLTGFDSAELSKLFDKFAESDSADNNFDVDENTPKETNVRHGDLFKIGNHRIICGDATNDTIIKKLMNDRLADLILTDPPYNVIYEGTTKPSKTRSQHTVANDNMSDSSFLSFLAVLFGSYYKYSKLGSNIYVFYSSSETVNFINAFKDAKFYLAQQLIWKKHHFVIGRKDYHYIHEPILYGWKEGSSHNWYSDRKQTTVLEFDKPMVSTEHPTMKPVDMLEYLIKNSSKQGDLIIDFCGGSGSTLIAADKNQRICYTCELDPKYVDCIIKRIENQTGLKAELV